MNVEFHEAGHALAAYVYNVPIQSVSTYKKDGEAGRLRAKAGTSSTELNTAALLVAGQLAEKRALGDREVFKLVQ